jgi:hypothetical protein
MLYVLVEGQERFGVTTAANGKISGECSGQGNQAGSFGRDVKIF